jgi:hypothetical protein
MLPGGRPDDWDGPGNLAEDPRTSTIIAMSAFQGFPPEAIECLRELEANNDRDGFKANRARYDEHLVAPATALGEDLADLGRTPAWSSCDGTVSRLPAATRSARGCTSLKRASASARSYRPQRCW